MKSRNTTPIETLIWGDFFFAFSCPQAWLLSRPLTCESISHLCLVRGICSLACVFSCARALFSGPISLPCSSVLACSLADLSAVPCARVLFSGRSIGCASCAGVFWLLSVGRRVVIYLSSSSRFHRYFVLLRLVRRYCLDFLPRFWGRYLHQVLFIILIYCRGWDWLIRLDLGCLLFDILLPSCGIRKKVFYTLYCTYFSGRIIVDCSSSPWM